MSVTALLFTLLLPSQATSATQFDSPAFRETFRPRRERCVEGEKVAAQRPSKKNPAKCARTNRRPAPTS